MHVYPPFPTIMRENSKTIYIYLSKEHYTCFFYEMTCFVYRQFQKIKDIYRLILGNYCAPLVPIHLFILSVL